MGGGALISLLVIVMVLLPGISKNYLIKHGKELTGRKLYIDDVSINYWRSSVCVTGFKMYESNV